MKVQVSLRAENLGNIAAGRWRGKRSNPYATVQCADDGRGAGATDFGQTEILLGNLDPQWTHIFAIEHDESQSWTPLRITIFDCRHPPPPPASAHAHEGHASASVIAQFLPRLPSSLGPASSDPMMGEVDVEVAEILSMAGQEVKLDLKQGGCIYVHVTESMAPNTQTTGEARSVAGALFACHLRGLDFENIEAGILGLGAIDPYFELSKEYRHPVSGITRWQCVYRSESIPNIINPYWQPFQMDLEKLCHGDMQKWLKLVVWDKQGGRLRDRFLGECQTSARRLLDGVTQGGNANRENALCVLDEEMNETGKIVVLRADLVHVTSPRPRLTNAG